MAILKQNGTSAKILRANQSGKALKQNYNFGNKIKLPTSLSIPSLKGMSLSLPITVVNFNDSSNGDFQVLGGCVLDIVSNNSERFSFYSDYQDNRLSFGQTIGGISASSTPLVSYSLSKQMQAISMSPTGSLTSYSYSGSSYNKAESSINILSDTINDISAVRLFDGYNYRRNQGLKYMSDSSYFIVYNRVLMDNELRYLYNNSLGNEPLNISGILLKYTFNLAEIFDFGVQYGQRIGIRDYSGNNHHIMVSSLPSGTLQEQLVYANDNLFEQW